MIITLVYIAFWAVFCQNDHRFLRVLDPQADVLFSSKWARCALMAWIAQEPCGFP